LAATNELSREDKHRLYELKKVIMLDDKGLREGVLDLMNKTLAGMTKEDVAWVEQALAKTNE
jgi:hypothetical protein